MKIMKIIRSDIYENLKMALATLRANKLRSFLTVFGVVIGIITVMLIASIISGIDVSVKREVESFGTRSIYISKYNPGIHIGRLSREERMRKELTYDDAIALPVAAGRRTVGSLPRHHQQLLRRQVDGLRRRQDVRAGRAAGHTA